MDKQIIMPGEKIADREIYMDSTYIKDGKTYAAVVGMCDEEGRYTPLECVYTPKIEDTIVGLVIDTPHWGYSLDINLPARAALSSKDTRLRLGFGDIVVGKIKYIKSSGEVEVTNARHLSKGKIFQVPPSKVPRIIGKKSSMLTLIKEQTKTDVVVGNNGYVWVSEVGNIPLLMKVLYEIITHAHKKGLTDNMAGFIEKHK